MQGYLQLILVYFGIPSPEAINNPFLPPCIAKAVDMLFCSIGKTLKKELMKALQIALVLVAVLVLTVSGVQSNDATSQEKTYKEYSPKDLIAHKKKKLKIRSNG